MFRGQSWKQLKTNEVCFLEEVAFKEKNPSPECLSPSLPVPGSVQVSQAQLWLLSDLVPLASESFPPPDPGAKDEVRRGVIDNSEPPCRFRFSVRADHWATEREVIRVLRLMLRLCLSKSRQNGHVSGLEGAPFHCGVKDPPPANPESLQRTLGSCHTF